MSENRWNIRSLLLKIDMITIYKSITINKTVNCFLTNHVHILSFKLNELFFSKAEPIVCVEASFWLEHK